MEAVDMVWHAEKIRLYVHVFFKYFSIQTFVF